MRDHFYSCFPNKWNHVLLLIVLFLKVPILPELNAFVKSWKQWPLRIFSWRTFSFSILQLPSIAWILLVNVSRISCTISLFSLSLLVSWLCEFSCVVLTQCNYLLLLSKHSSECSTIKYRENCWLYTRQQTL